MLINQLNHLLRDQRGATAIEYGLISALIAAAIFGALTSLSNTTSSLWSNISNKVTTASSS